MPSPVNLAAGLGMRGPMDEAELERMEAFYHERGAAAFMSMCPLGGLSLPEIDPGLDVGARRSAWVDGQPAGTGSLVIDGGVGWLSGDSTLAQYRRRGIQQTVQRHRLQLARDAGCDLAVTEAAPAVLRKGIWSDSGSASHTRMWSS